MVKGAPFCRCEFAFVLGNEQPDGAVAKTADLTFKPIAFSTKHVPIPGQRDGRVWRAEMDVMETQRFGVFHDGNLCPPRILDIRNFVESVFTHRFEYRNTRRFKRRHFGFKVFKGKSNMVNATSDTGTGWFTFKKDNVGTTDFAGIWTSVIGTSHVCHVPLFRFRP